MSHDPAPLQSTRHATLAIAVGRVLLALCCLAPGRSGAQDAAPDALRTRFAAVSATTTRTLADRPVYLQSTELPGQLQGDVYALIERPYADARAALTQAADWCAILILHLNVKYCRASPASTGDVLDVGLGRKVDQPLADVNWVHFNHRIVRTDAGYFQVVLQAPTGPLGTTNYRIAVEAVPHTAQQTLLHLSYGYAFGTTARWAMQAYLATAGSSKVGFSSVGQRADGQPIRVGGLRGALERNVMRYQLAVETHVAALGVPASLQHWFSATERHALQLHEIDREAYLGMKQHELQRQATQAPPLRTP